jgi:wyosine [tRNA(Phe)-imidazoG37] synthetase (radical SAM superfamily)
VRHGLAQADLVIPSLDAGDEPTFRYVNRPHPELSFDRMVAGLPALRREFKGRIWLEVFLVGGVTDTPDAVRKIAGLAKEMAPDKVQLNTVTRPPAEGYALSAPQDALERLALLFDPPAEVIAERQDAAPPAERAAEREELLALLSRRPCTPRDVADSLRLHLTDATKRLEGLRAQGRVATAFQDGKWFYALARHDKEPLHGARR